jgi:hypothetical protein
MQVEGDHPVDPGGLDRIGADPAADRHPRLVLLVALGVAEVRDDGGHRSRAGRAEPHAESPGDRLTQPAAGRAGEDHDVRFDHASHSIGLPPPDTVGA